MINAVTDTVKDLGEKTASLFESKPKEAATILNENSKKSKDLADENAAKVSDAGSGFLEETTEKYEQAKNARIEATK